MEEELKCGICLETVTFPVNVICCKKTIPKPYCYKCVIEYYKIGNRSLNLCGCLLDKVKLYYPKILWKLRDLFGTSICICNKEFDTTDQLAEHILKECLEQFVKHEGKRVKRKELMIHCLVCNSQINISKYKHHMNEHINNVEKYLDQEVDKRFIERMKTEINNRNFNLYNYEIKAENFKDSVARDASKIVVSYIEYKFKNTKLMIESIEESEGITKHILNILKNVNL